MHTDTPAAATPATAAERAYCMPRAHALLGMPEVVGLLKRLAVRRDPKGRSIGIDLARELMRYLTPENAEVRHVLARGLKHWPQDDAADSKSLQALLLAPEPCGPFQLATDVEAMLRAAARRGTRGFMRYRVPLPHCQGRAGWFQRLSLAVEEAAPGQHAAARNLARTLALQMTDGHRKTPAFALLSGPLGSGARQAARAIGHALQDSGYRTVEIEMSQIRCDEEAAEIDGSQPYWKGSRPGKVTGAVYRHPKTVVILHDLDKTLPAVQASLLPALRDGVMVDNFGLTELTDMQRRDGGGRNPTAVPMRDAIVLATASQGHELWQLADMAEWLESDQADLRDVRETVLASLRHSVRHHRGQEVPVFDRGALACWERQMVLFKPLRWQALLACAREAVTQACRFASRRLDLPVEMAADALDTIALAFLASRGGQVELDNLLPEQAEAELLTPLAQALIDAELGSQVWQAVGEVARLPTAAALTVADADREGLQALLSPYLPEPQHHLHRRRLALRFDIAVDAPHDKPWVLRLHGFRLAQVKEAVDYSGEHALTAVVPTVRFADVAGHDQAKQHLKEVIALYARADELRAAGLDLPRGAVLHGPPGTGKTLLAQAMAAEAGMAFLASNGTDLLSIERMAAVFALARKNAPCILFIDEADALGQRGHTSSAHDAAINRLLATIQGFDQRAPVYVLAASNRPKLLDPALTRPGRLDRSIYVGPLDRAGRAPLVDKLMQLLPQAQRDDAALRQRLLSFSHGMTGADLSQVIREATLRRICHRPAADLCGDDLMEQLNVRKHGDKVTAASRAALRERTAFHEAGHAVLHALWFPELPIEQVSVTARGNAEGFVAVNGEDVAMPVENRQTVRRHIGVLLGGRLAEVLHHGSAEGISSGCASDFHRARNAAFMAVAHQGLDECLGELSLIGADAEDRSLLPESLKQEVWDRVRVWLAEARAEALAELQAHWPAVQALAAELVAGDYVPGERVNALLAPPS